MPKMIAVAMASQLRIVSAMIKRLCQRLVGGEPLVRARAGSSLTVDMVDPPSRVKVIARRMSHLRDRKRTDIIRVRARWEPDPNMMSMVAHAACCPKGAA